MEVPLKKIYPNPDQPRKVFEQEPLEELALSIKEHGLIEPLVVVFRPTDDKDFMLVAGERRWRACHIINLETAPVRIIEANDAQISEMALIENIQREDLKPLEEAKAFKSLIDNGHTVQSLCHKLGFKHPWKVNWRVNLLNLYEKFQEALDFDLITQFEAYEMSRMEEFDDQDMVFHKIRSGELKGQTQVRRFVNALIEAKRQKSLFEFPKEKDREIITKWDKALESVSKLICNSFSSKDCQVLSKIFNGDAELNITKIDLIVNHLKMVKSALQENLSRQEAYRMINTAP
jgi:ParB family transcriptional regulator, chromosome partitioning protein